MAETLIAFRCNDFVIVAASGTLGHYYIQITDKEDKMVALDSHRLAAFAGENGSRVQFGEFVKCNIALQNTLHQQHTTESIANYLRSVLAKALRSRSGAYVVQSLIAGYDTPISVHDDAPAGTHLYYMDYLGTMQKVNFAAHGYGTAFVTATLDRYWKADMTAQEATELMQTCINEVKKRVIMQNSYFVCKVVSARGIENLDALH